MLLLFLVKAVQVGLGPPTCRMPHFISCQRTEIISCQRTCECYKYVFIHTVLFAHWSGAKGPTKLPMTTYKLQNVGYLIKNFLCQSDKYSTMILPLKIKFLKQRFQTFEKEIIFFKISATQ